MHDRNITYSRTVSTLPGTEIDTYSIVIFMKHYLYIFSMFVVF